ncbi:U3 small nucleolar RNA-associated protein 13 [Pseudozyma hubeiensis]|nr:U3 small nucleolar RNA-associated protein 13 [Pseudozyma hubeiensis]
MADAQVLTPDQVAQLLAAQQQSASTSSTSASTPSQPRLKTSFKQTRSLPPFYTGGSVALHPSGTFLYSTLNDSVCVVQLSTGTVVQQFSPDTEEITALTVTPTGSHLVVASRSLALNVYSLPECRLVRSVAKSHASQVNLMAVDPTGTLLATGGSDGVAKVWDLEGGFVTHAFKGNAGVVSALAWNMPPQTTPSSTGSGKKKDKKKGEANGRIIQLLTGSVDGKVRVWDLNNPAETNKPIATLAGHDSVVRGIAVTPDGATVVTGSRDRTLVIWRLPAVKSGIAQAAGWKQSETLSANEGIESVGFLPPSTFPDPVFYTGGSSGSLRLWSLTTSSIIAVQPKSFNENLAHQARQTRIQRALASSSSSRTVDHLDAEDEETRAITAVHLTSTPTGVNLVSVHADQNIVVRSVGSSHAVQLKKVRQLIGFNDEIVDLAMLSASEVGAEAEETHLAVATNSRSLRVYTLAKEEETSVELLAGHTDIVLCLDRSPDLRLLASGAKDKSVRIWAYVPRSRLGSVVQEGGADDAGTKISRSNGGEAGDDEERDGEWVCVGICEGHAESVGAIAFARRPSAPNSPYAPFIVSASQDRTVKIWDLSPLTTLLSPQSTTRITQPLHLKSLLTQRVHEKDINCLDISPNNAMLATGSQDRTAKLFHLSFQPPTTKTSTATARLSPLATLKGHKRGIWACRFSPVDLALATSSGDKSIRLWSLKTFSTVKLFEGHTNSVLKLAFLSAGMQLASCAGDGLVKIWNVKEEECQTTIDAHDDKIWSFVVSRGEERMVSAAADGWIKVWEDRTEEEKQEKRQEREDEVRMEQEFGNMLIEKDWRSAIGLALQMGQPRRLLGLFTHVSNSRPDEAGPKKNGLLASVLAEGGDSDDDEEEDGFEGFEQGDDRALEAAGIRTARRARGVTAAASQTSANTADANSITGLSSVDSILSTLPAPLLIQLLIYIRDWNTSTRTSPIAQTLLHAILSTHTASSLISMFDSSSKSQRAALAERLENEELGIVDTLPEKERARRRRMEKEKNVDLGTLVEGLLPYTERHWQRADRVLIESSMLEYSVEAMDTLLGFDDGEEEEEEEGEGEGRTFGEQLGSEGEGDVEMSSDDESA